MGGARKMGGTREVGGAQKMDRPKKMGSLWDSQKQSAGGVVKKSGSRDCHFHLSFKFRRA